MRYVRRLIGVGLAQSLQLTSSNLGSINLTSVAMWYFDSSSEQAKYHVASILTAI